MGFTDMKNCPKCGAMISDAATECAKCSGTEQAQPTPPAPAPETAPPPQFRFPWITLTLVLAASFLAHLSFGMQIFLTPILFIAAPCMAGQLLFRGVQWLLARDNPERLVRAKGALAQAVLVVLAMGGCGHGSHHLFGKVERTLQPVIDAAEKSRAKTGVYPGGLDELVPAYLTEVPSCPGNGRRPLYMLFPPSEAQSQDVLTDASRFTITCYTVVFWKYTYDSKKGKWHGWD